MKVISYSFEETRENRAKLSFKETTFNNLNLFVGVSGAGKSKLLNTMFNLAKFAVNKDQFYFGHWNIKLEIDEYIYEWELETNFENEDKVIKKENIIRKDNNGK
jgi:energy-coupling factor transporter ATP-binding protein EcfA2